MTFPVLTATATQMTIPVWGLFPFVVMLLCIAIIPLVPALSHFWEHPRNQLLIALVLGLPVAFWMIIGEGSSSVIHALFEYFQFISLLFALFVVSGGIHLKGDIQATPRNNSIFLAIGGVIASFIGTTGAAMLLIRPLLKTNHERKHVAHTVIFTILIVANCGGVLTPLGDPPLFLGMLRGVPFTWTFNLLPAWFLVNALLLLTYFALDRRFYAQESVARVQYDAQHREPLRVVGGLNFVFFAAIIAVVAVAPSMDLHAIEEGHAGVMSWLPLREIVMYTAAALSFLTTKRDIRFGLNKFSWAPIMEVAALFIGIFLTMIPALRYLGQVAPNLKLNEMSFYFLTGGLSSILDNAPTYATFFEIASKLPGDPRVAGVPELYLVAISAGAVFFGAMTYIGNGPNFMVKSVAESTNVPMPSFGGYILWTLRYLLPILFAAGGIFVASSLTWHIIGWMCVALVVARALFLLLKPLPAHDPS